MGRQWLFISSLLFVADAASIMSDRASERDIVWARIGAKIENIQPPGLLGIRSIEHDDLTRHVHRYEQAFAVFGHAHELGPSAFGNGREIKHRSCVSFLGID